MLPQSSNTGKRKEARMTASSTRHPRGPKTGKLDEAAKQKLLEDRAMLKKELDVTEERERQERRDKQKTLEARRDMQIAKLGITRPESSALGGKRADAEAEDDMEIEEAESR
jgi:hypothetical protein